jgi:hypothetical protein
MHSTPRSLQWLGARLGVVPGVTAVTAGRRAATDRCDEFAWQITGLADKIRGLRAG